MAKKIKETKKRITLPEDVDRLAEQILNEQGDMIQNRSTYDKQYTIFMETGGLDGARNTILRDKVFKSIIRLRSDIDPTELKKVERKLKIKPKEFPITAKSKDKIVFARKVRILRRGKRFTFLRDRSGRFVKAKYTDEEKMMESE